ncbi:hypothetical protein [Longivirga aurantiaca]|uniref:Uncharacterized protein n=1 Tax=Longivirga aurantiaca TaxID=1837743 RepID=A0ABW1T1W8_9ACTN
MQTVEDGHRPAASEFTPRGRIVITVLLLVLPLACLALALTSAPGSETAWLLIAVANLVLPAVMLPLVWRGAWRDRASVARRALESAGARDALVSTRS